MIVFEGSQVIFDDTFQNLNKKTIENQIKEEKK